MMTNSKPDPTEPPRPPRITAPLARGDDAMFRLLVENVRDYAIFALDPTGRVLSWNPGAQRFKGYLADEIIGRHFSTFYPPEDIAAGKPEWELEVAAREGRFEDEGWRLRKDGTRFWANVVITALRAPSGELLGFAKITRDLTERRAAEQQAIEDARRVARSDEANRTKSTFLAAMSHELRTPLNAIGGYSELLLLGLGGEIPEQQRQYLQRIRGSQQHLLAIINDLLNFSRIESGQLTYDIGPASLCEVIDAVAPMIAPQAKGKQLDIRHPAGADAVALADRAKVEQILLNLLSNAVKFTASGGRIELECERVGDRVALRVTDTGVGISAGELVSIFEPFVQVGRTLTSPHEGTGLGLAISRDLARAMHGELLVESTPGEGSRFTLWLPAYEPAATPAARTR
jgi:PAS domain S-box-containing protein